MSFALNEVRRYDPATNAGAGDGATYRAAAFRLYRERRVRTQAFAQAGSLFGEPGWDILLELYVAAGKPVYVGNACIAAEVAQTTGLRWVSKLEHFGLLTRDQDPVDRRRGLLALTARGEQEMENYLRRVGAVDPA